MGSCKFNHRKLEGLRESRHLSWKASLIKGPVRLLAVLFFFNFNFFKFFLNLNDELLPCAPAFGQTKDLPLRYSLPLLKEEKPLDLLCKSNSVHLLMVKSSGQVLLKTLSTKKVHPCGCYTYGINANIVSSLAI